jgi:hypothetical protein
MLSVAPNGLTLLEKAFRTYSVCDELPQGVQLRIRAKPRTDADTIGMLGYGGSIEVYGLEGDWLKVQPSLPLSFFLLFLFIPSSSPLPFAFFLFSSQLLDSTFFRYFRLRLSSLPPAGAQSKC